MKDVWIVHPYCDYGVAGVFETEELAKEAKRILDNRRIAQYLIGCKNWSTEPSGSFLKDGFYYVHKLPLLTEVKDDYDYILKTYHEHQE